MSSTADRQEQREAVMSPTAAGRQEQREAVMSSTADRQEQRETVMLFPELGGFYLC